MLRKGNTAKIREKTTATVESMNYGLTVGERESLVR